MVKNDTFAICATIFATAYAVLIAIFGSDMATGAALAFLLFAAMSQFVAQGGTKFHYYMSTFYTAVAFVCAVAAGVTF